MGEIGWYVATIWDKEARTICIFLGIYSIATVYLPLGDQPSPAHYVTFVEVASQSDKIIAILNKEAEQTVSGYRKICHEPIS